MTKPKPVILCILDGWGHREDASDNAISVANTPYWDKVSSQNPMSLLETSGLAVGLPDGQMGNSEVGHMNIGSGRIVMQSLPMIDESIKNNELATKPEITDLIAKLKDTGGVCHIAGLMSPGGVHSHQEHIGELAKIVAKEGIAVKIHAFLDGRDVPPGSAPEYIRNFNKQVADIGDIEIATICGRYYAMDRDNRWERVQLAYDAIVSGNAKKSVDLLAAIEESYAENINDEFLKPAVLESYQGANDGDGFICANFRADRAREITSALGDPDFSGFVRDKAVKFSSIVCITELSKHISKFAKVIFKPTELKNNLGEVIANNGLKQLRTSETEKYAHVTFFFNGGLEDKFAGEERILVPSPNVATYDLQPEMSAREVTENLQDAILSEKFDLIVVNYANTDMVGHTGSLDAAVKAVETVDACISKLDDALKKVGGVMFITADHGNSEQMENKTSGQPHTSHTTNPVPFVMAGSNVENYKLKNGRLCDIAPTILEIMQIEKPVEMTGVNLIEK